MKKRRRLTREEIESLTERQARLYRNAERLFRENMDWGDFHYFALHSHSALFDKTNPEQKVVCGPPINELAF